MVKSNTGLVEYARAQLGRPYWFGTFGTVATEKLLHDKAAQYKSQFSKTRISKAIARGDIGQKVHDCLGLWKGYMMSENPEAPAVYNSAFDYSADSIYKKAVEKGTIDTLPDIPGIGLYKKGHFGVYIGGGREIEARGFDYGVIEDAVTNTAFTNWFKIPHIEYGETAAPAPAPVETPANASKCDLKPVEVIVSEVIAGKWGNGAERVTRLNAAGYNASEIQAAVNAKLNGNKTPAADPAPATWAGIVNTNSSPLRVRAQANTNCAVIKLLPKGSRVTLTGDAVNGFYKLADGSGYVSAAYIKK